MRRLVLLLVDEPLTDNCFEIVNFVLSYRTSITDTRVATESAEITSFLSKCDRPFALIILSSHHMIAQDIASKVSRLRQGGCIFLDTSQVFNDQHHLEHIDALLHLPFNEIDVHSKIDYVIDHYLKEFHIQRHFSNEVDAASENRLDFYRKAKIINYSPALQHTPTASSSVIRNSRSVDAQKRLSWSIDRENSNLFLPTGTILSLSSFELKFLHYLSRSSVARIHTSHLLDLLKDEAIETTMAIGLIRDLQKKCADAGVIFPVYYDIFNDYFFIENYRIVWRTL